MDFTKLIKVIYEMGEVVVSTSSAVYTQDNDTKVVGKTDEYEGGIEIMFDDGSTLWLDKERIEDIIYTDFQVRINYDDGSVVKFEQSNY